MNIRIFYIILIMSIPALSHGQDYSFEADTLQPLPATPAILRSIILPGWGQIYQERLSAAAIFAFTTIPLYMHSFYYLDQYNKYSLTEDKGKFTAGLSAAILLHLTNIIDVADAAKHEKPTGWRGGLLGDKPMKSPWGAVLRSSIIPGWGQAYNDSYFKAILSLGANAYMIYKGRTAHKNYLDTGDQNYLRERSKYNWYFGIAYLLNMADAYAGAYLYKFEKSMQMTMIPQIDETFMGMHLYVRF